MVGRTDAPLQDARYRWQGRVRATGRREPCPARIRPPAVDSRRCSPVVSSPWSRLALRRLVAGCAGAAAPASFDPAPAVRRCRRAADGRRLPRARGGRSRPARRESRRRVRESGRYCSATTLGTLAEAGHRRGPLRGRRPGTAAAARRSAWSIFEADGLTATGVYDSYLAGARANRARSTTSRRATRRSAACPGYRLDFLNGDSSFQRILVWPGDRRRAGPGRSSPPTSPTPRSRPRPTPSTDRSGRPGDPVLSSRP